jgi:rod shape-determining protein MreB
MALGEIFSNILDGIRNILEITHPELSADIMVKGLTLTGGGALLRGIKELFQEHLKIPVNVVEEPLKSVALGTGQSLEHYDVMRKQMNHVKRR